MKRSIDSVAAISTNELLTLLAVTKRCEPEIISIAVLSPVQMESYAIIVPLTTLLLSVSLSYSTTPPTYASCLKEANSVVINDWCFALLMDGIPYADYSAAEQICRPNGHLAAPMTQLMLTTLQAMMTKAKLNITTLHSAWLGMMQNFSSTSVNNNWYWRIRTANNEYQQLPILPLEVIWSALNPNDGNYLESGKENYGILLASSGVDDVNATGNDNINNRGVLCQFRAPARMFVKYSVTGIFNIIGYTIKQVSVPDVRGCSVLCSVNEFCQSFSYAASTLDCQLYAVTPLDPAKTLLVISNSNYVMYTRNSMK